MNAPFSWWWAALALALTLGAVLTGRQYVVAVPLAAGAVAVAVVAVLEAIQRQPSRRPAVPVVYAPPATRARAWLGAGRLGREELILLMDRMERRAVNPTLPIRSPAEMVALVHLSPAEFRQYLAARLARIEAAS